MTRRFSQMLMAFLFPNKAQQTSEIAQVNRSNKSSTKNATSASFKRRTRSAEVRIRFFLNKENRMKTKREVSSILFTSIGHVPSIQSPFFA
jgi:hypothetical protein